MAAQHSSTAGTSHLPGRSVPAIVTDRFKTLVTFDMPGATWDYVNAMHKTYRFHENWPEGMLCHITGEVGSGIRSIGLWTNREIEQEFFRKVAMVIITDSIHELGPPPVETDGESFAPRDQVIERVVLTELCDAFADIGPDLDGDAIHSLGTEPVIVSFPSRAKAFRPFEPFKSKDEAPEGLIIAWTTNGPEGKFDHEVWSSSEHAGEPVPGSELHGLKRISFGSSELHG